MNGGCSMEMTTSKAIEVLKAHNEWRNGGDIPTDRKEVTEALDKAIEVMEAYIQIGNVKPYHRTIK